MDGVGAQQEVEFRILGPLEVLRDGRSVPLTRAKQRALLLALLLRANEVVSVDSLVDALWGERPPPTAHVALQGHVSQVRKVLPPQTLVTRPPGYVLQIEPEWVDAYRFELLREQAREALVAGDPDAAATALREALALWRGSPLVDLADDSLLRGEAGRLEELRVAAVEERVEAELVAGRDSDLVPELELLVQASPFRERLRAQLMLALYRAGRQADALQAYADARQALVEELGIEPGPDLQRLQQQILRQDPALRPRDAAPTTGLIVGRSSELRELRAAVHDTLAGRGRLLLLKGAAGIGKTRLVEEIEAYARAQGAATLWGRSYEGDAEPPYWPWLQMLRELPPSLVVGRGAALVAGGVEEETADAERDRFRVFDDVWSSIRARAIEQPLVLVLEDLHWADPASLLVLLFAARNMRDANVLIVGTYREDDLDRTLPLTPIVAELRRERLCDRIHLDGLAPEDVSALVEALAGDAASSLAATLHADTGGNPFFVREILGHLVETGRIGEGTVPGELDIPHSVREVVGQRLTRLSDACRELLTLASVLGEFSETVAARILGVDRAGMLARLDEATVAGVLVETGLGRYAFSHALVRETLAAQLDTLTRLELHRRAGETLEEMYGNDLEPHLGELAHHFFEAARGGDVRKAIDYCRRAAEHDTLQLAYEQAAQRLARALQLLEIEEGASPQERCELLLTLGDAYWRSGAFRKARRTFREAAELARAHGPAHALARSALGYAGGAGFDITVRNDFLAELLADALAALPPEEELLRARLLARLAQALTPYSEREQERAQLVDAALLLARDDATLAYVITSAFLARWTPERVDERLEMASTLVDLAARLRNHGHRLNGLSWRIQAYAESGDVAGIDADLREWDRLFERRPVVYARWGRYLLRALRALLAGDAREGRRLAELALETGQAHDNPNALQLFAIQSIGLARLEGSAEQLRELGRSVLEQFPTIWAWRAIMSALHAWSGHEEEARRELARIASEGFESLPRDLFWTSGMVFCAETAALLDAGEEAEALYAVLEPIAHLHVVLGWALYDGSVARRQALLAATLGRFTEAEAHFLAAIESERRMGAAAAVVQSQCDYAFVLARTGRPELLARASELIASALPVAERLELPGPVERLTALQRLLDDDASRT